MAWRQEELHEGLRRLISRIDAEREHITGRSSAMGMSKAELALAAGLSSRQYHRYLRGQNLPRDGKGVAKILHMARIVGLTREEAESYLPRALEVPKPVGEQATLDAILVELKNNSLLLQELLDTVVQLSGSPLDAV